TARRDRRIHVPSCRRWPSGLVATQIEDEQSNMETCHEIAYRCSRACRADCGPDPHHPPASGAGVPGKLVLRSYRLLIEDKLRSDPKVSQFEFDLRSGRP